jgi:hypothetical protein
MSFRPPKKMVVETKKKVRRVKVPKFILENEKIQNRGGYLKIAFSRQTRRDYP